MDLLRPDTNPFGDKTRWADYYAAVLREKHPAAADWLRDNHGTKDPSAVDARIEEALANQARD